MKVCSLGAMARQVLLQQRWGHLLGVTSHGLFLHAASDWVLFLSAGPPRGPLTLNLDSIPLSLREQPGDPVLIRTDELWFPTSRLSISLREAEEWSPPPPNHSILSANEMGNRLEAVARQVRPPGDRFTGDLLESLTRSLQDRQAEQAADLLSPLIGRGPGLTPAGDDLVMGLLLALNRWRHILIPGFCVERLNFLVNQDARTCTTTLSASLIECATLGQADERLMMGMDGLVTGVPDAPTCADIFNSWGATSGASAFTGIRTVIECTGRSM